MIKISPKIKKQHIGYFSGKANDRFGFAMKSLVPCGLYGKSLWLKFAYVLILAAALSIFTFHLKKQYDLYLSKPVTTSIEPRGATFTFPDLTFCNNIPFSMGSIVQSEKQPYYREFYIALRSIAQKSESWNLSAIDEILTVVGTMARDNRLLHLHGHKKQAMFLSCKINGLLCADDEIKLFVHDIYANCFTFSPRQPENTAIVEFYLLADSLLASDTGKQKFKIGEIPMSQVRFNGDIRVDTVAGVKLFVHPRGTYPSMSHIIQLGTGQSIDIKLRESQIHTLNTGSSIGHTCNESTTLRSYYQYDRSTSCDFVATTEDCYNFRILQEFEKQCECFPTRRIPTDFNNSIPYCYDIYAAKDQAQFHDRITCAKNVTQNEFVILAQANCLSYCMERHYEKEVTSTSYPMVNTINDIINVYFVRYAEKLKSTYNTSAFIVDEFISINQQINIYETQLNNRNDTNSLEYLLISKQLSFVRSNLKGLFKHNFLKVSIHVFANYWCDNSLKSI